MTSPSFGVQARRAGGRLVIAPSGELDISTVAQLRDSLAERGSGEALELDLRGLRFLDTSGLQLLVEAHRRARAEGFQLTIVRGSHTVQRVFEIAGLDRVLPFTDPPAGDGGA